MKKSSSKSYYNLRSRFRFFPGSSQKKSATSQQIVEDYCDQCVREGNENQISCEICSQENADTLNTTNPPEGEIGNQEPLNTDQSESPSILQVLNALSENPAIIPRPTAERADTSSESSPSNTEESASEESLHEEAPLISLPKRPRKLFQNEKEGSSDHLEYNDFIPFIQSTDPVVKRTAEFDNEMDASTLQGLQQTIIELQQQLGRCTEVA